MVVAGPDSISPAVGGVDHRHNVSDVGWSLPAPSTPRRLDAVTLPPARPDSRTRPSRRVGEDRILSLPNVVTTSRLVLVPVFVWLLVQPHHRDWFEAAILLAALGSTDWVDGQLARRLDQVTNLGKILDPTADRVLLATAVIGILAVGAVPIPVAVIAMAREGLVAVAAVGLALAGARRINVTLIGKAGTFGLMCAFPLFLTGHSTVGWRHTALMLAWASAIIGLVLGWASVVVYIPLARGALAAGRSEAGPSAALSRPDSCLRSKSVGGDDDLSAHRGRPNPLPGEAKSGDSRRMIPPEVGL